MEQRLVYRIEDAKGIGPFREEGTWTMHEVLAEMGLVRGYDETDDAFHSAANGFPGPQTDPWLRRRYYQLFDEGYVCGCRSAQQLARWFPPILAAWLEGRGYEVTVWSVPREAVAYGRTQVLFNKNHPHAALDETMPPLALHRGRRKL